MQGAMDRNSKACDNYDVKHSSKKAGVVYQPEPGKLFFYLFCLLHIPYQFIIDMIKHECQMFSKVNYAFHSIFEHCAIKEDTYRPILNPVL